MEFFSLSILSLFFLMVFAFAFWPLVRVPVNSFDKNNVSEKNKRISRLMFERENIYKNILEVRFDRAMKKLSNEDYSKLLNPLNQKALNVLRRLEALGVKEGDVVFGENQVNKNPNIVNDVRSEIEEEILRYRNNNKISAQENAIQENLSDKEITSVETTFYCATCGNSFGTEDKFCSNCGSEIK